MVELEVFAGGKDVEIARLFNEQETAPAWRARCDALGIAGTTAAPPPTADFTSCHRSFTRRRYASQFPSGDQLAPC
jgi:hypothetical protein